VDVKKDAQLLREESRVVWDLMQSGSLRESYFKDESYEAVLIFESNSVEAVGKSLARLPLVREKYIRFDVYCLRPYTGLQRLFCRRLKTELHDL
jgi:muconolactone delta-isomerase